MADPENADRVLKTIQDFGFETLGLQADFLDLENVIRIGDEPNRIDLITDLGGGLDFEACFSERQKPFSRACRSISSVSML